MLCCSKCFGDKHLEEHINTYSENKGSCSFCPKKNTSIIQPKALSDKFSPLLDLYTETTDIIGEDLISLLKNDWGLFPELDNLKAAAILDALNDTAISNKKFKSRNNPDEEARQWDDFKKELKHSNRFFPKSFPKNKIDLKWLLSALSYATNDTSLLLYRARLNTDKTLARPKDEMGCPPPILASGGRANPVGIPYLYVGSTRMTAISEIRPHKSDAFTIGVFSLEKNLNLVDLRSPKKTTSPFINYEEDSGLEDIHRGLPLLEHLGSELTKPISKSEAELEYLSSQYLCEFIKSLGYDGVVYKSALGDGDNYAIYSTDHLRCISTELHNVNDVSISFSKADL